MESKKRKIVLVWGYHRKGWVDVFNRIADDVDFELLFHLRQPENETNFTNFPVHYWLDYRSATDFINQVRPDKVVFMSTEGIPSTALNAACKRRKIPTIMLQHGMFQPYENYLLDEKLQTQRALASGKNNQNKPNDASTNKALLKFYIRSFTPASVFSALTYLIRLKLLRRKHYAIEALRLLPSRLRLADYYVVFTADNVSALKRRDRINPAQLIEIGNPEFDEYTADKVGNDPYYLYIHSPLTYLEEWDSEGFMSQEQENDCFLRMAVFAERKGCKLIVKLHPYSYDNPHLVQHPSLEYVREGDNVSLILKARGVFGFNSTLVLPAAYFKNVCLFTLDDFSHIQEELNALGVVTLLPFHTATPDEMEQAMEINLKANQTAFVKQYLYRLDGLSTERFRQFLLDGK